jgi:hypothetical protein
MMSDTAATLSPFLIARGAWPSGKLVASPPLAHVESESLELPLELFVAMVPWGRDLTGSQFGLINLIPRYEIQDEGLSSMGVCE